VTAALIGVGSALLGLALGSSITHWSTRRGELAAALVALANLSEQWREDGVDRKAVWAEQRPAVLIYLHPRYARVFPELPVEKVDALADLIWEEHNRFILAPLWNWMNFNSVTKRVDRLLR
jgi:hypothetical protein